MGDFAGHPFRGNQWTQGGYSFSAGSDDEEKILAVSKGAFGREITRDDFARMAGIPKGTPKVQVQHERRGTYDRVRVSVFVKDQYSMERIFNLDEKTIRNENFMIAAEEQGKGFATRVLLQQAEAASAAGFQSISTRAAGYPGSDMNGYYTWPRLGYIPAHSVGAAGKSDIDVVELMRTPEGRDWWKANGTPHTGRFDLTPGSLSMRILRAYAHEKGVR